MSSPSPSIRGRRNSLAVSLKRSAVQHLDRWFARATWAFVILGVLLRIARYLMNYPLWWDEAFVSVNFIRRDYLDLLRPLDYGQVCPILFLWCELALVKLLGFSEWSLRLFPLVCGIASVVLFQHVAGRIVRGLPLLLAVAIFATSFHPIIHAADVKPYASDLLAALMLLAIAAEWSRAPERARWLWTMAAVAPIALALSHPAIFVAAGNVVGLAPTAMNTRRMGVKIAYAAFSLSTVSAFLVLYFVFTSAQAAANLTAMQTQWSAAFPPLGSPFALIKWLATVHTSSMFAYPCGGEKGASTLTLLLFAVGIGTLWYRGRTTIVMACLVPFAMGLMAAAIRRYPYGGPVPHGSPARVMQYLAPSICLLAGIGAASILALGHNQGRRLRGVVAIIVSLALVGIIPLAVDVVHPYRAIHAHRAREFARQFWPDFVRDATPVCLRWDLGIGKWDSTNLNVAVYLCNQMIYAPHRWHSQERALRTITPRWPLRCVSSLTNSTDSQVTTWLEIMKKRYQLRDSRQMTVNMAEPHAKPRAEHYSLYEFVPKDGVPTVDGEVNRAGVEWPVSSALELLQVSQPELFSP
jgi:hypothetical protein